MDNIIILLLHNFIADQASNQSSDILQHSQNKPTGDRWLTLIGLGFFLTCLGLGGSALSPIIFVVCKPIPAKFCTGIDNQSISSTMEKST